MTLSFQRTKGGTLLLGEQSLAVMDSHRQGDDNLPESGGILLGRWIAESDDVVVDSATSPVPEDRRGRFYFWRAREPAQRVVNAAWLHSDRSSYYLGEWHSHPEDQPTPSEKDLTNWQRILREARYEQATLFFVIVGRESICAWEGDKATGAISQLTPVESAGSQKRPGLT